MAHIEPTTHCLTENQGFSYLWLSKQFQTHPLKLPKAKPSFKKVNLLPEELGMLFPIPL